MSTLDKFLWMCMFGLCFGMTYFVDCKLDKQRAHQHTVLDTESLLTDLHNMTKTDSSLYSTYKSLNETIGEMGLAQIDVINLIYGFHAPDAGIAPVSVIDWDSMILEPEIEGEGEGIIVK